MFDVHWPWHTGEMQLPPPDVVYGLWREETFAVLDARWAAAAAAELDQWERAGTVGEARRLSTESPVLGSPVGEDPADVDEEFEGHDDSDAFRLGECGAVEVGDWPPMPASLSCRFLPEDFPLGEVITTTLNGDYLYIGPEDEDYLVRYLHEHGSTVRRDDGLINFLGRWP
jgi:hypothetical protein